MKKLGRGWALGWVSSGHEQALPHFTSVQQAWSVRSAVSHSVVLTLCNPRDCSLPGSFVHGSSPGKNTGVGCPPPGDLPNPGIEPRSPTLQADSLPSEPPGKPWRAGELSKSSGAGGRTWGEIPCRWTEIPWGSWPSRSKRAPQNPSNWGSHPSAKQGEKAISLRHCDHIPALPWICSLNLPHLDCPKENQDWMSWAGSAHGCLAAAKAIPLGRKMLWLKSFKGYSQTVLQDRSSVTAAQTDWYTYSKDKTHSEMSAGNLKL